MATYKGSCHCGRIAFEVDGDIAQVVACNCSMCGRRGALHWFVPRTQLRLSTPDGASTDYLWNKKAIHWRFCPTCGCAPYADGTDKAGNHMAAVNARCLEGVDPASLKIVAYNGRDH